MAKAFDWNFGDMLDALGEVLGDDAPALIHGDRMISWPEMTARFRDDVTGIDRPSYRT